MATVSKAWLDAQEELEKFKCEFEKKYGFLLTIYMSNNRIKEIPRLGLTELLDELNLTLNERHPSGYVNASFGNVQLTHGIKTKTRARDVVIMRQLFCYISRELGYSTVGIGKFLGKDHATVIHGVKAIKDCLETNHAPVVELYTLLKGKLIVKYGTYEGNKEQGSDSE